MLWILPTIKTLKLARNPEDISKVRFILDEILNYNLKDVPDPYYGGENGFDAVYEMLDTACEIIANKAVTNNI